MCGIEEEEIMMLCQHFLALATFHLNRKKMKKTLEKTCMEFATAGSKDNGSFEGEGLGLSKASQA